MHLIRWDVAFVDQDFRSPPGHYYNSLTSEIVFAFQCDSPSNYMPRQV